MAVFGTRPEAIKLAPVLRCLAEHPCLEPVVTVSGQHREMLDQVLELFGIRPDHDLAILSPGQSLTRITTRALEGLSLLCEEVRPDAVLVQGDTTTTFAGALAAFYHQVPVVHLEAGLRTHDRYAPFPEEVNRLLTTQLTSLHLAATPGARVNLLREGVHEQDIAVTGNTVIDALQIAVGMAAPYGDPALDWLDDDPRRVLLVTAHRRESWGAPLEAVGRALARIAEAEPDVLVVLPIHRNPVVRDALAPAVTGHPNVVVVEPLSYGGFARLMARSDLILTDSGGIQEEGPSLGKPVLVMRDLTERPEAVEAGTARLVGTDDAVIEAEVLRLLRDGDAYEQMARAVNPYGDGQAAPRCVAAIGALLGVDDRREEFVSSP
jgi:UDP-N-acetylglucosamine 2-epimerase (non-hydrolysing)